MRHQSGQQCQKPWGLASWGSLSLAQQPSLGPSSCPAQSTCSKLWRAPSPDRLTPPLFSLPPNRFLNDVAVRRWTSAVCFSFRHYLSGEFLVKRIMLRLQIARELRLMGTRRTRHLSCPAKFLSPPLSPSSHLPFLAPELALLCACFFGTSAE